MITVCVVDVVWAGSIITYHKLFVETFLRLGCRVVSLSPAPAEVLSHVGGKQPAALPDLVAETFADDPPSSPPAAGRRSLARRIFGRLGRVTGWEAALDSLRLWRTAARRVREIEREHHLTVQHVFLAYPDTSFLGPHLLPWMIDRVFPFSWSGLYLHPVEFRRPWRLADTVNFERRKAGIFRARRCLAVATIDEGLPERLRRRLPGKRILVLPDFTDETLEASPGEMETAIRTAARGRKIIGLFGELSLRKGILTLLEVARTAAIRHPDWFFAFAGPLNDSTCLPDEQAAIRAALDSAGDNCFFRLGRIADGHEFNAAHRACDIIFAAYIDIYHSSAALLKAALSGHPVIGSRGHLVEERIIRYRLGLCIPQGDAVAATRAVAALIAGVDFEGGPLPAPDFAGYRAAHSIARLEEGLRELLQVVQTRSAHAPNSCPR